MAHTSNHSAPETEADMDLCLCSEVQADLGYAEKTKNKMKIQGSTRHQQLSLLTVLQPTSSFSELLGPLGSALLISDKPQSQFCLHFSD